MKILHINSSDIVGGAARAAYRIHRCLVDSGVDSHMLVINKASGDWRVHDLSDIQPKWKRSLIAKSEHSLLKTKLGGYSPEQQFAANLLSNQSIIKKIKELSPDVIHLHWVANIGLNNKMLLDLKSCGYPFAWTMHDEWAYSGGFHYYDESGNATDLSNRKLQHHYQKLKESKKDTFLRMNIHWVTPSKWLGRELLASGFATESNHSVIKYPIDLDSYKPIDKRIARSLLKLDPDKKYIAFGAVASLSDKRKGYEHLVAAIKLLGNNLLYKDIELIIFGAEEPKDGSGFEHKTHFLGHLYDDVSLMLAYNAANVFIAPSKQDNLPNTVIESLACGTPVVAFDIGGMPDMIKHKETGWLAEPYSSVQLAEGLEYFLNTQSDIHAASCRESAVDQFSERAIAIQHKGFYHDLLDE